MDKYTMLGIYIEYTHEGTHELMSYNSNSSWVKLLGEITELKQIDKPVNQTWSLEVLQKIESGNIIRVICPNAGRNDYICASIYVPWNIVISGKELSSVVSSTRDEIMSWRKETSKSKLMELFSKKYDVVDFQRKDHIESPSGIAYRYYGDYYQLHELLDNIEQPYYSKYKFVFLVNNKSNILIKTGDDLTKKDLVETVIMTPPGEIDGFAPYIGKTMFNKPLRVAIGESITLSWVRKGYKTIDKTTVIAQKNTQLLYPQINEHEVEIPFSAIQVYDEKNHKLNSEEYTVRINGKPLVKDGAKVYVNIASLKSVRVDVTPEDTSIYETSTDTFDLSNDRGCNVQLERVHLTYVFKFPMINNKYKAAEFTFHKRLDTCPFKGFAVERDNIVTKEWGDNYLRVKVFNKTRIIKIAIILFVALLLGAVIGWYCTDWAYEKSIKTYESQISTLNLELEQAKQTKPTAKDQVEPKRDEVDWGKIVEYLDKNAKWERSAMEKFAAIQGLWDALNYREFENILQYEEDLKASKTFSKLVKAIKTNEKSFSGPYCDDGDTEITISTYIGKLGKIHTQTPPQNNKNKGKEQSEQNEW